ncbi:hypothetical protein IU434_08575 [Nocardia farcinica]|uniref:hypothetical protein n=1 Tax=Nocardia farcinica TaxID=37329 RepID=UPI0018940138|nr:hypothetical protein [Nocardia farcinica]MBF6442073.1 hypothetical protein [Nocardia farcinica]
MTAPAVMGARAARSVTRRAIANSRSTARSAPVLWKLATGCGSAYSVRYHDEKLYLVTTNGTLARLDVAESAVRAAEDGVLPPTVSIKAPEMSAVLPSNTVEITTGPGDGVVVECVERDGRLRVHIVSPGYRREWNVQFPPRHPPRAVRGNRATPHRPLGDRTIH